MIEIGNERTFEAPTRRVASAFGTLATLIILVWLARGYLFLASYSFLLLSASFSLIFVGRFLRTSTNAGAARAASSFLWNITLACIIVLILIWFLGWVAGIQSDVIPAAITQEVPNLVIVAVAAVLLSVIARALSPTMKWPAARGPAIIVGSTSGLDFGKLKLSTKKDSVVLPVRSPRETLGALVIGDVAASFDTPMGVVTGTINGPVTTLGIPFRGERADGKSVSALTGKTLSELTKETPVDATIPRGEIFEGGFIGNLLGERAIDLPFVQISRNASEDSVKVGPFSVSSNRNDDEDVEVGPFTFNPCDWDSNQRKSRWFGENRRSKWLAKGGHGPSYVSASPDGVQARWNGTAIRLAGESMKMATGSDGFVYTPNELETYSPLHALHVTNSKATLNTRNFTLNVSGDKVVFRTEEGSKKTESAALAKDLRDLLTETANNQVKDVMTGEPMELDDMLVRTEEVLKKYE